MHIELLAISRSPGAASPVLLSVKSYVRRRGSCKRAWVRAYTDQTKKDQFNVMNNYCSAESPCICNSVILQLLCCGAIFDTIKTMKDG